MLEQDSTIYIAGPMTGIKDWNYPLFFEVERQLNELGYNTLNPARNDGRTLEAALTHAGDVSAPKQSWAYYMKRDIPALSSADAIVLLPGWQNSRGASLEVTIAKALGLPQYVLRAGKLKPRVRAVGLCGYARSGKDEVAKVLTSRGFIRIAFADALREALYALNPLLNGYTTTQEMVDLIGWEGAKVQSHQVRELLQRLGTEVGRAQFGENFWVDLALSKIPDDSDVVFTDVRFPNEVQAVESLGGDLIRVTRPNVGAINKHVSESALDAYLCKYNLHNDGSLDELKIKVLSLPIFSHLNETN